MSLILLFGGAGLGEPPPPPPPEVIDQGAPRGPAGGDIRHYLSTREWSERHQADDEAVALILSLL